MYEESLAIGSMNESHARREAYAKASHAFNASSEVFCKLFGTSVQSESAGAAKDAEDEEQEEEDGEACRFCFSSKGKLINPCECKDPVHIECLKKWQREVLLSQPTHPKYQTTIDRICNVCLEPFTGEGIPPSRHEQIKAFTSEEIADLVAPGNLLVSTGRVHPKT